MHGLDQSQALTAAARALSAAKKQVVKLTIALGQEHPVTRKARLELPQRQQERDAAYKAYTNPFDIKKTT